MVNQGSKRLAHTEWPACIPSGMRVDDTQSAEPSTPISAQDPFCPGVWSRRPIPGCRVAIEDHAEGEKHQHTHVPVPRHREHRELVSGTNQIETAGSSRSMADHHTATNRQLAILVVHQQRHRQEVGSVETSAHGAMDVADKSIQPG